MGFLTPSFSDKDSKKLRLAHWAKVLFLFSITGLLTWYGKFYKPAPMLTRINEFAVWVVPCNNSLSALVVLPNDNNDSNDVRTGLRIWLQPPDSLLAFERTSAARYRGKNIVAIGDSLNENLKRDLLSTLDSSGNFYWLVPPDAWLTGEDVFAELKIMDDQAQNYILDIVYEGHKLRFFGSQTALDSSVEEPLSVAVLMFEQKNENEPPLNDNKEIQSLIWLGKNSQGKEADPSRIGLNYDEAIALISYNKTRGLSAKRARIKNWNRCRQSDAGSL
ncbi:hypothetical protein R83H12_00946 [Fibrobacteria bacterium R8-3-H12]